MEFRKIRVAHPGVS